MTAIENLIVVGVDGSTSSTAAALWAAAEARRRGAALRLLQAYEVSVGYAAPGVIIPDTIYADVRHGAEDMLSQSRDAVAAEYPGIEMTTELVRGMPFEALKKASEHALLTVVGSHGASEIADSVLGAVAQRITGHAGSPVVVVRTGQEVAPTSSSTAGSDAGGPVVVGLDGSAGSENALSFAFEEASLRGTALVAIHSWDNEPRDGLVGPYRPEVDRERFEGEQRLLAEQLSGWSEKYPDVQVQPLVLRGHPAASILRHFQESSGDRKPCLIVVGSRGRGGFAGLVLGSTSHALIAHARCPVGVVRGALRR